MVRAGNSENDAAMRMFDLVFTNDLDRHQSRIIDQGMGSVFFVVVVIV
jgi:hypothetical protein